MPVISIAPKYPRTGNPPTNKIKYNFVQKAPLLVNVFVLSTVFFSFFKAKFLERSP